MKFLILAVLAAVFGGMFVFNKHSSAGLCPLKNEYILVIGDSLANGYGVNENDSFALKIPTHFKKNPIKRGINGERSDGLLGRIDSELARLNSVGAIIISIGGNDILRKVPSTSIENNLNAIILKAKQKTNCVILLGVPDGVFSGIVGGVADFYENLAKKHGVLLDSKSMPKILKSSNLKLDQIHPNNLGHEIITQNIIEMMEKNK